MEGAAAAKGDIKKKQADIDAITQTILASKDNNSKLDEELRESLTKRKRCLRITEAFCKAGGSFKETGCSG